MKTACRFAIVPLALLVFGIPGCGSDGLNTVEGTVTLDGSPLQGAFVNFSPEGGGRPASAVTDDNGHFELKYTRDKSGAPAGTYQVRITTSTTTDDEKPVPEKLPDKYNLNADKNPEMKKEVKSGRNVFEFKLDSKGKITPPKERERMGRDPDSC